MDENLISAMNTPSEEFFKSPEIPSFDTKTVSLEESALGELARRFGMSDIEYEIIRNLRKVPSSQVAQVATACIRHIQSHQDNQADESKK